MNMTLRPLQWWFLAVVVWGQGLVVHTETIDYCDDEDMQISCPRNQVLMMTSAQLGRMEVGRCIPENEFIGCSNDVLPELNKMCSGHQECKFEYPVINLREKNKECSRSLILYLRASHVCQEVETICKANSPTVVTKPEGYISSHTRNSQKCGSPRSPWILSAQHGQTINMTLIDFGANEQNSNFVSCKYVYGYILERALGINHTICGGQHRKGALYSSKTNKVEVFIAARGRSQDSSNFLINFQVNGCPELERPAHTWYRREGNEAVIGCEDNDQEWQLTCTGNTWQGSMGNCTGKTAVAVAVQDEPKEMEFDTVIIMTSVAGGAVVAVVVTIVIGIVYIKKYRMRKETKHLQKTYATMERELQAYYRPTQADMTLLASTQGTVNRLPALMPADLHANQMMSYPDQCSCATLPSRDTGDVNRLLGGSTEPRQSIYSAVK